MQGLGLCNHGCFWLRVCFNIHKILCISGPINNFWQAFSNIGPRDLHVNERLAVIHHRFIFSWMKTKVVFSVGYCSILRTYFYLKSGLSIRKLSNVKSRSGIYRFLYFSLGLFFIHEDLYVRMALWLYHIWTGIEIKQKWRLHVENMKML